MNNKPTVTVGIPAYNEEGSIGRLVTEVLAQELQLADLVKIIVVSDHSSDNTDQVVLNLKHSCIQLIRNTRRLGKALTQNLICESTNSDILIILDADILVSDKNCLNELIRPIICDASDLVGGRRIPLKPKNYIESIFSNIQEIKDNLLIESGNTDNIYFCPGTMRAFSRKLYTQLRWPATYGEDVFSYLWTKHNNFKFAFSLGAISYYRSPHSIRQHLKQSIRYQRSRKKMYEYFDKTFVDTAYSKINKYLARIWLELLRKSPLKAILYPSLLAYSIFISKMRPKGNHLWSIAKSSKNL